MVRGTVKQCWKCRGTFAAGDANYFPYTCDDCKVETYHLLEQLPDNPNEVASVCGKYTGWPHTWPDTQGHVIRVFSPNILDKRRCPDCLKAREPVPTGQD